MKKIDAAILRETLFIALAELAFSVLMELIFVIFGAWDYTVPLGNLLGAGVAVLNFFLMGLGVQSAVALDEKGARDKMRLSMRLRWVMIAAAVALGVIAPCFNTVTAIVPLFFVRIAVAFRPLFGKFLDKSEPQPAPSNGGEKASELTADSGADDAAQTSNGTGSTGVATGFAPQTGADSDGGTDLPVTSPDARSGGESADALPDDTRGSR